MLVLWVAVKGGNKQALKLKKKKKTSESSKSFKTQSTIIKSWTEILISDKVEIIVKVIAKFQRGSLTKIWGKSKASVRLGHFIKISF